MQTPWKSFPLFVLALLPSLSAMANNDQLCTISGLVYNEVNKTPIARAAVSLQGTSIGTITDAQGAFKLDQVEPGIYNIVVSHPGFKTEILYNIRTRSVKPVYVEIDLVEEIAGLDDVVIEGNAEAPTLAVENNIAHRQLEHDEIQRFPGATLDLSKAIQAYPGMLPQASFGYNLSTRGGAPSENGYYLDGVKIPGLNHFAIQGSSGGPNGLINLDFVRQVDLHTGIFPVQYANVMSSVVDIHQRDGRSDRLGARFTLGATDVGATIEGPVGSKGNFIASTRYSYSQYLLRAFNVPVLPTYGDAQFRFKWRFDPKNEIVITGVGGSDVYRLNMSAPESDALLYNIGYIPEGDQKLYGIGVNYKHYLQKSYYNVIVSTNGLENNADKFVNNTGDEDDRLLRYRSTENEIHFRLEHHVFWNNLKLHYGVNAHRAASSFDVYGLYVRPTFMDTTDFTDDLQLLGYGGFANVSRKFFNGKLEVLAGLRLDGNNYNAAMANPLKHFSPRTNLRYRVNDKLGFNASTSLYYQRPENILLAFSQNTEFADGLSYIEGSQTSIGGEYKSGSYRFSLEGYYKTYNNYPFLLKDSIAAANALANYVAVGNQPAESTASGLAYGVETFVQQKLKNNYWWMLSYTWSVSEFEDANGELQPSAWDSRHLVSLIAGKSFKKGWQVGLRFRYSSGTPYTPYDTAASALVSNWDVARRGLLDYDRINSARLPAFHQMDLRIDKRWNFDKSTLNLFFDIQNLYESNIQLRPYLTVQRDAQWNPQFQQGNPSRYLLQQIESDTGRRLYSLGVVWEF